MKKGVILALLLCTLFISCTLQKRVYRSGYYIAHKGKAVRALKKENYKQIKPNQYGFSNRKSTDRRKQEEEVLALKQNPQNSLAKKRTAEIKSLPALIKLNSIKQFKQNAHLSFIKFKKKLRKGDSSILNNLQNIKVLFPFLEGNSIPHEFKKNLPKQGQKSCKRYALNSFVEGLLTLVMWVILYSADNVGVILLALAGSIGFPIAALIHGIIAIVVYNENADSPISLLLAIVGILLAITEVVIMVVLFASI
jgi:hypothetical protein